MKQMWRGLLTWLNSKAKEATTTGMLLACLFLVECERICNWWSDHDAQGEASEVCQREEFPETYGPDHWVVRGHYTDCGNGDSESYVYLHLVREADGTDNLILTGDFARPAVSWIASQRLHIDIGRTPRPFRQVTRLKGMVIDYGQLSPPLRRPAHMAE